MERYCNNLFIRVLMEINKNGYTKRNEKNSTEEKIAET